MRKTEDQQQRINLCFFILTVKGQWEKDYHTFCKQVSGMSYEQIMKKGLKHELS